MNVLNYAYVGKVQFTLQLQISLQLMLKKHFIFTRNIFQHNLPCHCT